MKLREIFAILVFAAIAQFDGLMNWIMVNPIYLNSSCYETRIFRPPGKSKAQRRLRRKRTPSPYESTRGANADEIDSVHRNRPREIVTFQSVSSFSVLYCSYVFFVWFLQ